MIFYNLSRNWSLCICVWVYIYTLIYKKKRKNNFLASWLQTTVDINKRGEAGSIVMSFCIAFFFFLISHFVAG